MRDKIIILDTNDLNRSALCNILCNHYTMIEAKSATDSFVQLKEAENEIAAVLIDMLTSENDGFQLLKAMQVFRYLK